MAPQLGRRTSVALVVTILSAGGAQAQKITFNPVISLEYIYLDNVQYVGEEGNADSGLRLGLQLPVVRNLRKGSLAFSYSPQLEQYQDFGELDNTGHRLNLNLDLEPTPVSSYNITTEFSRSQEQGDASALDGDIFIGRRTEQDRATFDLSYRNRLGGRFLWGFSTQYADWSFKDIEGFDPGTAEPIGDRTSTRASLDLLRSLSRSTNLGVRVGYGRYELDQLGEDDSRDLGLVLEHAISQNSSFTIGVSGFESEGNAATGQPDEEITTRQGVQGFVTVTRQLRKARLALSGFRSPSAGGNIEGTSTDSSLGFSVSSSAGRRLNWSIATRYGRREPNDVQRDTIDTVALGLTLEVRLHRKMQLRFAPLYTRQVGNDAGVDSLVLRGGFGFAWAPLERTRLGGGGGWRSFIGPAGSGAGNRR